ncbi:hypothetical protein HDR66_01730 [bacterium]|nr:hypothetical protein [bacterium]
MKINLHCHTNYSDGDDIFEMAREHKAQGFSAFVATDHVYPLVPKEESYLCVASYEKFQRQTYQLEQISKQLNFPCIQGMELALWGEEVLVFGAPIYKKIFDFIDTIDFSVQKNISSSDFARKNIPGLIRILQRNKAQTAIVLCHPRLDEDWVLKLLYPVLDGYEFQNSGRYYFTDETNIKEMQHNIRPVPPELQNKNKFYNSDAHSVRRVTAVGRGNFHDVEIKTLNDLVGYIKTPQRQK